MPLPPTGASHGSQLELAHLVCHCQLQARPRRTLCGLDVDVLVLGEPIVPGSPPCVVCWDMGRTVLVARRCERCAA